MSEIAAGKSHGLYNSGRMELSHSDSDTTWTGGLIIDIFISHFKKSLF